MPVRGECVAGRYRLESPLGEGGMGSVWKARHLGLDAPVALKFQHPHRADSAGAAARFRREARAAAKLTHPNVVRVADYGIDGEVPFIAMELLEGESLKARLERLGSLTLDETVRLVRQAASALDAAHAAGIVHRDLKPSNLLVVKEGEHESVKLLDFGIAKWFEGDGEGITEEYLVVGSAQYMSPEQARGETVDARTDVWSLGVVAFQILTGELPFQGANIPDTLRRVCSGKWQVPSLLLGPEHAPLDPVFARAFELEPELRFESAGGLASALAEAARTLTPGARPTSVSTAPSGWVFGRDGATASVPVPRSARRSTQVRRAVVPAVLVGLVAGLVTYRHGSSLVPAPVRTGRATIEAPAVAVTVTAARAVASAPHVLSHPATTESPSSPPKSSPTARRHARAPHPEPQAPGEPAAPTTPASPTATAARSHVDPVFGLEVPAPR